MLTISFIFLSAIIFQNVQANWWSLGLKASLFSSNRISQVHNLQDFCKNFKGLTQGQTKLCELYTDHVTAISKGARIAIMECQWQFRFNQWNCSTISNSTVYGSIIEDVPSRESAFVHAISSAGVLQSIARSCRNGDISACGCSKSKRPENLNKDWVWGGCGDNLEYGYKFSKHFVDMTEKSVSDDKKSLLSNRFRFKNRYTKSINGNSPNTFEIKRAMATKMMNLHNNEAGRRAVYRLVKIECKCHGVSGSCSMKTCWLKLPSFREVGDYLKEKYDSAIEVRYESRQNQLRPRYRRFSKPTKEDLVYIQDSPNYCNKNEEFGIIGTSGRQCNKHSNGLDGCRIMCCGRGYYIAKTIKEEKCKCKFQWCCSVKCETCVTEVETYICK